MSYLIQDIEITRPFPKLTVRNGEKGLGILLRYQGSPVDFRLAAHTNNCVQFPRDLTHYSTEFEKFKSACKNTYGRKGTMVRPIALPTLTIAICTRNRPTLLAKCLNALLALKPVALKLPVEREILVVDNSQTCKKTRALVESMPGVRYAREAKPGLNFARNRALREARHELLAFLDDDTIVDCHWLEGLMKAWAENRDAVAFTGQVLPAELNTKAQIMFEQYGGFRKGFKQVRYGLKIPGNIFYPCDPGIFGTGANMAFRRDILLQLGGFDEALDTGPSLPGGGDTDIFYRVIRAGYTLVYEPSYLIFHYHRQDVASLKTQLCKSWGEGYMAFVAKSFRADPSQRLKFIGMIVWWFTAKVWHLFKSLLGCHPLSPRMILAKIGGGSPACVADIHGR